MKKVILTIAVGLMTIVGFSQNFEYINSGQLHGQDIQTLDVMNTLFKPDTLKSKCDSTLIKKFFKKKFNKKFVLVQVQITPLLKYNTISSSTIVGKSQSADSWFMSVLPQNHFYIYTNKVIVSAHSKTMEILMENKTDSYFFEVNFETKVITVTETTKISVDSE